MASYYTSQSVDGSTYTSRDSAKYPPSSHAPGGSSGDGAVSGGGGKVVDEEMGITPKDERFDDSATHHILHQLDDAIDDSDRSSRRSCDLGLSSQRCGVTTHMVQHPDSVQHTSACCCHCRSDEPDETQPDTLEAITHMAVFVAMLCIVVAFTHWHYASTFVSMSTIMLVYGVTMYSVFMRRREHKAIRTLMLVWMLWLTYSVVYFSFGVGFSSVLAFVLRDMFITLQVAFTIGFRIVCKYGSTSSFEPGTELYKRTERAIGSTACNFLHRCTEGVYDTVTIDGPNRVESLDRGASIRASRRFRAQCRTLKHDLTHNLGMTWLCSSGRVGFIVYNALLIVPFVQNNAVAYNVYWSIVRVTTCYVLYKIIDAIYRPRLTDRIEQSGPTIVSIVSLVLYVHPFLLPLIGIFLFMYFVVICVSVNQTRRKQASAADADATLAAFTPAE